MTFSLPRVFSLLPRNKRADKSHYGHVLVVAGSQGYTGAAILASRAASKSGSGLVTLGTPRSLIKVVAKSLVEVMQLGLPETKEATLGSAAYPKILKFIQGRKINALAVGPGLSQKSQTQALVRRLVRNAPVPMVLDADGLNSFRSKSALLRQHAAALILTPHQKEFERVFSQRWPNGESARVRLAKRLSRSYDVILVLKGFRTLVVSGDRVYVNKTGNPGMAKGGAGDVLTGMIASFIAQGLDPFLAAVWGVYFHGKAGDLALKDKGELGLLASDIVEALPKAFSSKK